MKKIVTGGTTQSQFENIDAVRGEVAFAVVIFVRRMIRGSKICLRPVCDGSDFLRQIDLIVACPSNSIRYEGMIAGYSTVNNQRVRFIADYMARI